MSRRRYKCLGVGSELEVRSQSSSADSGQKGMAVVVRARHLEQAGRACVRKTKGKDSLGRNRCEKW